MSKCQPKCLEGDYEPPPPDRVQVDPALKLTEREIAVLRISRATTAGEAVDLYEFHGIGKQVWAFAYAVCRLAGGVVENPGHCKGGFSLAAWALGLPAASKGGKPYIPSRPYPEWEAEWAKKVAAMPEDWPLWDQWVREAESREAAYKAAYEAAEKAALAASKR